MLRQLIRDGVSAHFNEAVYADNVANIEALRDEMRGHPRFITARDSLLDI